MPPSSPPKAASTGINRSPATHAGAAIISASKSSPMPPACTFHPSRRLLDPAHRHRRAHTPPVSRRATIASTSVPMPPRSPVKMVPPRFASVRRSSSPSPASSGAPRACPASVSRTSSPSPPCAATPFARSVASRPRHKSRSAADQPAGPRPPAQNAASPTPPRTHRPRSVAAECSSSSAILILVRTLNSGVIAVGTSLVGTRNISPSGSATRRLRVTI